jgi:hypothetical protein
LGYSFPGRNKYRNLALQIGGSFKYERVKYDLELCGNPRKTVQLRPSRPIN